MRLKIFVLALAMAAPAAAVAAAFTVPIDQSRVLPFNGAAASVVVGNTDIADVRAIDTRTLVLVGKRPGMTNVLVLDGAGRTLFNEQVTVSANQGSAVTIYRGGQAQEFSCSPYCQSVSGSAPATPAPTASTPAPAAAAAP